MSEISTKSIIKQIKKKQSLWKIQDELFTEILEEGQKEALYEKYQYEHYRVIYRIPEKKMASLPQRSDKIAYIDSLIINYSTLIDTRFIDFAIGILSGSAIGCSFSDTTPINFYNGISIIVILILLVLKAYMMLDGRRKFYIRIFENLKANI